LNAIKEKDKDSEKLVKSLQTKLDFYSIQSQLKGEQGRQNESSVEECKELSLKLAAAETHAQGL
jgi:hypothetical protein